jgi:hypothetical protein
VIELPHRDYRVSQLLRKIKIALDECGQVGIDRQQPEQAQAA